MGAQLHQASPEGTALVLRKQAEEEIEAWLRHENVRPVAGWEVERDRRRQAALAYSVEGVYRGEFDDHYKGVYWVLLGQEWVQWSEGGRAAALAELNARAREKAGVKADLEAQAKATADAAAQLAVQAAAVAAAQAKAEAAAQA